MNRSEREIFHNVCIINQWITSPLIFLESSVVRYLLCF